VRILVLTNLYPPVVRGGYEAECAEVVARLRERHEVVVLTSAHRRRDAPTEDGVARELPFLPPGRGHSLAAPLSTPRAARLTRGTVESFGPDFVFVWNGSQIPHAALRILADTGLPLAYRVCEHWFGQLYLGDRFMRHLTPGERGLRGAWARLVRAVNRGDPALRLDPARTSRAAISWNSDALRRLTPMPPSVEPVLERTIYPATSQAARFERLERRPAERTTIAFVGAVKEEKGPDVALRALALLRTRHGTDARLVMAGPVERRMRRELESLARELGVAGEVEIAGRLESDAVGDLLSTAHALVVPSVWEEPFGLVCLEGALARIPLVASRVGGIPECVRDREHALLVPPGDADACAAALAETLSDVRATRDRVARAFERGRELSLERYLDESERFVSDAMAEL
jgi:glycosyltransferase involved in cell wall biosynthesis